MCSFSTSALAEVAGCVDPTGEAVRELTAAVARVSALVVHGHLPLAGADAVPVALALHAAADLTRALAISATAVVDELDAARTVGCPSTSQLLQQSAGMSRGGAAAAVALARTIAGDFQSTREAWMSGNVSEAAVREITTGVSRAVSALSSERACDLSPELEAVLLEVARTGTVADVRRAALRLKVIADPEGADQAQLRAHDEQFLRFTPVAEGVDVSGRLTHEAAAGLLTALDRIVDGYHQRGEVTALQAQALESGQSARRVAAREHLNALALTDLTTTALDGALLGHKHDVHPLVTYTIHHDELESGIGGWLRLPGLDLVPLPVGTIDRVSCDADVHPVLTSLGTRGSPTQGPVPRSGSWVRGGDGASAPASLREAFRSPPTPADLDLGGADLVDFLDDDTLETIAHRLTGELGRHVLDLGRTFRTAPPDLRRALEVRDRHCSFPGCRVDPSRCQAHHVVHWRHGGETSLRNMTLLCLAHHHAVHEGGWDLRERPGTEAGDPHRWCFTAPRR